MLQQVIVFALHFRIGGVTMHTNMTRKSKSRMTTTARSVVDGVSTDAGFDIPQLGTRNRDSKTYAERRESPPKDVVQLWESRSMFLFTLSWTREGTTTRTNAPTYDDRIHDVFITAQIVRLNIDKITIQTTLDAYNVIKSQSRADCNFSKFDNPEFTMFITFNNDSVSWTICDNTLHMIDCFANVIFGLRGRDLLFLHHDRGLDHLVRVLLCLLVVQVWFVPTHGALVPYSARFLQQESSTS